MTFQDRLKQILGVSGELNIRRLANCGVYISYEGTNQLSLDSLLELSELLKTNEINFSGYGQDFEWGGLEKGFEIYIKIDFDEIEELGKHFAFFRD